VLFVFLACVFPLDPFFCFSVRLPGELQLEIFPCLSAGARPLSEVVYSGCNFIFPASISSLDLIFPHHSGLVRLQIQLWIFLGCVGSAGNSRLQSYPNRACFLCVARSQVRLHKIGFSCLVLCPRVKRDFFLLILFCLVHFPSSFSVELHNTLARSDLVKSRYKF
jgi:hypothetical protein